MKFYSQKGQVTIEYILLTIVLLAGMRLLFNSVKDSDMLNSFVSGPNEIIGNMMENGVWDIDEGKAREKHPNQYERHWTWNP